jgi:hypothetical protein
MAANHRAIEAASATYERRKHRPTHLRLVPPPPGAAELQRRAAVRQKLTTAAVAVLLVMMAFLFLFVG